MVNTLTIRLRLKCDGTCAEPDFVFWSKGRVHLNRQWRQFIRLLAAEVCASALLMLDTPCSEVVCRVLATHSIHQFPLHFPSRTSPWAITFQLDNTIWRYQCSRTLFVDGFGRLATGLTAWTSWNLSRVAWKSGCPVVFVCGWVGPFSSSVFLLLLFLSKRDAQLSGSIKVPHHVFTDTVLSSCKLLVFIDFDTKLSPEVGLVVL